MKKDILILGIETSCDDTAISVVQNGELVLSNIISSQAKFHEKYGGFVPEVAARKHIETITFVLDEALSEAKVNLEEIDTIAVTKLPGLQPSLVVGIGFAKGLALGLGIPLLEINHLEAHIYANHLYRKIEDKPDLKYPYVGLLVSGGHSELWLANSPTSHKLIGSTRDDSSGEAFDKVARMLGLGFPGGPIIDKMSQDGDEMAINFPRPMIDSPDFDFSFSGLKTAVRNEIIKYNEGKSETHPNARSDQKLSDLKDSEIHKEIDNNWKLDIVASFQEAVIDVLVSKTIRATQDLGLSTIVLGGGVSANSRLREMMGRKAHENGFELYYPNIEFCFDNGAMIAGLGYWYL